MNNQKKRKKAVNRELIPFIDCTPGLTRESIASRGPCSTQMDSDTGGGFLPGARLSDGSIANDFTIRFPLAHFPISARRKPNI